MNNLWTGIAKLASSNVTVFADYFRPSSRAKFTSPSFSPDGRYVIYASRASNLAVGDTNQLSDIYARDLVRGVTILLSVNRDGTGSGNGASTIT